MKFWKKAFTLTELLVVVIVLGVLAAVAVPKFSRVLETRRTTEAENMLSAVRMEQEKRCTLGKKYTGDFADISTVAYAKTGVAEAKSSNYTYKLTTVGVEANRADSNYTLKIPSYKSGELCCSGEGCEALNKSYPDCATIAAVSDECAADACDVAPNTCDCATYANNNKCECSPSVGNCCAAGSGAVSYTNGQCVCPSGQKYSGSKCVDICGEGEYWDAGTSSCKDICSEDQVWNSSNQACEDRCGQDTIWDSESQSCVPNCTDGKVWNEETKRCESACTPSCGSVQPALVTASDTCDRNKIGRYSCNGNPGTCIDIFEQDGVSYRQEITCCSGQTGGCTDSAGDVCTTQQKRIGMVAVGGICRCPDGSSLQSSETCDMNGNCSMSQQRCVPDVEEEGEYTCFTSVNTHTVIPGANDYRVQEAMKDDSIDKSNGIWSSIDVSEWKQYMSCDGSNTTVTYTRGQAADCEPGKKYLYGGAAAGLTLMDGWPYSYYQLQYACLVCGRTDDLSKCGNFTVTMPEGYTHTNPNDETLGFGNADSADKGVQ